MSPRCRSNCSHGKLGTTFAHKPHKRQGRSPASLGVSLYVCRQWTKRCGTLEESYRGALSSDGHAAQDLPRVVVLPIKLNPAGGCNTLRASFTEFGSPLARPGRGL